MSLSYKTVPVTAYQQNCSVVWCTVQNEGIVIDPGGDVEKILTSIAELNIKITAIVLTHGHIDHVGGSGELSARLNACPILGPGIEDKFYLDEMASQSRAFHFPDPVDFVPSKWLMDGDVIRFGEQNLQVLHTPGHTPGHVIFYSESFKLAFVGDVLFNGSIGRTDFPKGNFQTLIHSIKHKLWPLGNEVRFVSGHGSESSFGFERRTNPFVADEPPVY